MKDKIKMEILGLSSSQSQSGSFALVLGEQDGNRRLPIIIGMFEAQAIAIEIEKITPNRPMTHDLFKSFAFNFDYTVKEIVISDLKEGVFFARLVCEQNGKVIEIDARPSDAIAIGLRFDVEIYAKESILEEAGIVLSDESEEEGKREANELVETEEEKQAEGISDMPSEKLNELLNQALEEEDYEGAAKIRDELNRRN
ncbi:MAG: bifunctional nuclease domain-containing protein [Cyclobacteriaceae bacterium]|jgi:bifunctional DNase/RNase